MKAGGICLFVGSKHMYREHEVYVGTEVQLVQFIGSHPWLKVQTTDWWKVRAFKDDKTFFAREPLLQPRSPPGQATELAEKLLHIPKIPDDKPSEELKFKEHA